MTYFSHHEMYRCLTTYTEHPMEVDSIVQNTTKTTHTSKTYAMTELTQSERLEAARRKFQELKKRNEHLFKPHNSLASQGGAMPTFTESNAVDLTELNSIIEQQKATIKKLRDENTNLKLEKMDLSDKVAELDQQLSSLRNGRHLNPQHTTPLQTTPLQTTPRHSTSHIPTQSPNNYEIAEAPTQSSTNSSDIKDHIMKWKHWHVDMRDWNGSKYTQIVL